MEPFQEERLLARIARYIEEVARDPGRRAAEVVLILFATFGVWGIGAVTLLTWPLRHLQ